MDRRRRLWRLFCQSPSASDRSGTGRTGKMVSHCADGRFFETGEQRRGSGLETSVLVRSKIKATGGIRGDVPLSPDLAAISFHEKARVQPSYPGRAYHPVGNEADHDQQRQEGRAVVEIRSGVASSFG